MTGALMKPGDPEAVLRDAIAALDTPRAGDLLASIEHALTQSPNDFRLWHVHGLILRQLDRREEAILSLRKAAALGPHVPKIALGLARTLFEAGLPCIDEYGEALRLSPGNTDVILGLTSAFLGEEPPPWTGQAPLSEAKPSRACRTNLRTTPLWRAAAG